VFDADANDALHVVPALVGSCLHDEQKRLAQVRDLQVLEGSDGVVAPCSRDVALQLDDVQLQEKDLGVWVERAATLVVHVPLASSQRVSGQHGAVGDVVVDEVEASGAVVLVPLAFHALADRAWPGLQGCGRFERRSHSAGNVRRQVGPLFVVVFLN